MALVGKLTRQSCRHINIQTTIRQRRAFHPSISVGKKKQSNVVIEDLFADIEDSAAIISQSSPDSTSSPTPAATPSASTSKQVSVKKGKRVLAPNQRLERFNALYEFVAPRIGKKSEIKLPQVKKSAWVHMVNLATTEEQLTKVVEMFPKWRELGWEFHESYAELVTRRCHELNCPLLALKMFGDYSRYGLPMSVRAGRQLLFSLHDTQPIDKTMATAALFSVYKLPPVVEDLPSCALVVLACLRNDSTHASKVASALLPHLQKLIEAYPKQYWDKFRPWLGQDRSPVWIKQSLGRLSKVLKEKHGEAFASLLNRWRQGSEVAAAPSL